MANGQGVSPEFKDIAQEIANFLYQKGILIVKCEGKRKKGQKYALNPDRFQDIASLANLDTEHETLRHLRDEALVGPSTLAGTNAA